MAPPGNIPQVVDGLYGAIFSDGTQSSSSLIESLRPLSSVDIGGSFKNGLWGSCREGKVQGLI